MEAQREMDVMEGGREFENPSAYRSWAPPKYKAPKQTTPEPKEKPTGESSKPTDKPVPKETPPKAGNPGNGAPATFEDMFGSSPNHIKVEGSIDYTKPYVMRISGKTYDHSKHLKSLGFKWGPQSKTWYKGIEPSEGKDAKAALLDHIKGVSDGPGAPSQLKATITQGNLVPKKRTMSASEASLFGVKR
jgi:hypothetical protein